MANAIRALEARGLVHSVTNASLGSILQSKLDLDKKTPPAVYCGFDPTADSLHLGNLVSAITLRHFQLAGITPIVLVGGATGLIGDPSGKKTERVMKSADEIQGNTSSLISSLDSILDFDNASVVNNFDWYKSLNLMDLLRKVGPHFRIASMLAKESVASRMNDDDGDNNTSSLSFLEFSYPIFQSYDFLHLYQNRNCVLQVGGSDQWGNITSGVDLVRRVTAQSVYGLTTPLLTTSNGEKFGKSAGNAIWLDRKKTSEFEFYQYFINTTDEDVYKLLCTFTFKPVGEIRDIVTEHERAPHLRLAQKALANSVTTLVHGKTGLETALNATELCFGKINDSWMDPEKISQALAALPSSITLPIEEANTNLFKILKQCNLCSSVSEGRRLVKAGGLYVNNERVVVPTTTNDDNSNLKKYVEKSSVLLLRAGKKKFRVVTFE